MWEFEELKSCTTTPSSPTEVAGGSKTMTNYLIVVQPTETRYSAFSPDLDGYVATGRTPEEVE